MEQQKSTILVIEDEEDILALVHYNLTKEGYEVIPVTSGEKGLEKARQQMPDLIVPDLIVLDLMLPGIDGLQVCRELKASEDTEAIPIIMLTARGEESDVVAGLKSGADDYITKPFSPRILGARAKAVLRRKVREAESEAEAGENSPVVNGDLVIHPGKNEVTVADEPVELTYTEFRVLYFLATRPGWVFTRYQIVNTVRGDDYAVTDRAVDVQIVGLRRKLGHCGNYIETVRGVGYRFKEL